MTQTYEERRAYYADYYQRNKERYANQPSRSPEARRNQHLKATYGISSAEFDALLEQQGGHCALCPNVAKRSALHVDHDHATGQVRGLLCGGCNRVLGFIEARPGWTEAAHAYLKESS